MENSNYLDDLEHMRNHHLNNVLIIQEKVDSIFNELNRVFDKNEEYVTGGLPLMKATKFITEEYLFIDQISPNFIFQEDPVIQYIREGVFSLCEYWFVDRSNNSEFMECDFPRHDFEKVNQFFLQFLKTTNTDPDSLVYWNYIY